MEYTKTQLDVINASALYLAVIAKFATDDERDELIKKHLSLVQSIWRLVGGAFIESMDDMITHTQDFAATFKSEVGKDTNGN